MSYVAKRNCTFGGVEYRVGDMIPHDAVLGSRVQALIKNNTIVLIQDQPGAELLGEPVKFDIPIFAEEGTVALQLTAEEIVGVFSVLQVNAEHASETIKEITSEDVLILLDVIDSRKTIKTACKERAQKLVEAKAQAEAEAAAQKAVEEENVTPDDQTVNEEENMPQNENTDATEGGEQ